MSEHQLAIRELKGYLEYGEIKVIASKHAMALRRAYDILQGRIKPKDRDQSFIMACYDKALPRKEKVFDKIKVFTK